PPRARRRRGGRRRSCPKAMRRRSAGTTGRAPDRAGGFPQEPTIARRSRRSPDGAEGSQTDPSAARRRRGAGPPRLGAHGSRLVAPDVPHSVRTSAACVRSSLTLPVAASVTSVRRCRRPAGSRTTRGGRVLHERRLTALDSSPPLLFLEAIPGGGKRAMLRRW